MTTSHVVAVAAAAYALVTAVGALAPSTKFGKVCAAVALDLRKILETAGSK